MANNIEKLLETYVAEVQEFETAAFEVLTQRWLDTAVGVQLDGLGKIVGKEREGADDDTYRRLLRAQILINLSGASVQEIVSILELVIAGAVIELKQEFPAGFTVVVDQAPIPTSTAITAAEVINQARAGGVRGLLQYYVTDPVFRFDGAGGSKFDGGYYFSTTIEG